MNASLQFTHFEWIIDCKLVFSMAFGRRTVIFGDVVVGHSAPSWPKNSTGFQANHTSRKDTEISAFKPSNISSAIQHPKRRLVDEVSGSKHARSDHNTLYPTIETHSALSASSDACTIANKRLSRRLRVRVSAIGSTSLLFLTRFRSRIAYQI